MISAFQKGKRLLEPRRRSFAINVTPLIDVLFLLLIFLLLSTTFKLQPVLKVDLPRAHGSTTAPAREHTLTILKSGTYALEGQWVAPRDLLRRLEGLRRRTGAGSLALEVDRDADAEALVYALDAARASGYKQIDLPTIPRARERDSHGGNGKPRERAGSDEPVSR